MCSISASGRLEQLLELVELNRYRGEESHSITQFNWIKSDLNERHQRHAFGCALYDNMSPMRPFIIKQHKAYGPLDEKELYGDTLCTCRPDQDWDYCIVHQQAPTSKEVNNTDLATGRFIHPAEIDRSYLWHNGIIKEGKFEGEWDTEWLLDIVKDDLDKSSIDEYRTIVKGFVPKLNSVDGTFACMIMYDKGDNFGDQIYAFRNEISPLFVDDSKDELPSFSSTKAEGFIPLDPNTMFMVDHNNTTMKKLWKFKTKENPYHFGE